MARVFVRFVFDYEDGGGECAPDFPGFRRRRMSVRVVRASPRHSAIGVRQRVISFDIDDFSHNCA